LPHVGPYTLSDLIIFIFVLFTMLGGLALIAYALSGRQRMRELMMRERIALIEKGLAPPPEIDPARFDQAVGARPAPFVVHYGFAARGARYRSAGIMIMGFGAALFLLLAVTAGTEIAIGVGGGSVVLGAAVFLNGVLWSRETVYADHGEPTGTRQPPMPPPPNVGP
jgi:hypothetical protein